MQPSISWCYEAASHPAVNSLNLSFFCLTAQEGSHNLSCKDNLLPYHTILPTPYLHFLQYIFLSSNGIETVWESRLRSGLEMSPDGTALLVSTQNVWRLLILTKLTKLTSFVLHISYLTPLTGTFFDSLTSKVEHTLNFPFEVVSILGGFMVLVSFISPH